jgi:hypothetical protein
MSTRALLRNMRVAYRPANLLAARTFTVSAQQHKTATDAVKQAADKVDRTVADAAIKGLEGVEKMRDVTKDVAEKVGIRTEKAAADAEVETKATATKAKVRGEHAKEEAKAGVRETADKVKEATR